MEKLKAEDVEWIRTSPEICKELAGQYDRSLVSMFRVRNGENYCTFPLRQQLTGVLIGLTAQQHAALADLALERGCRSTTQLLTQHADALIKEIGGTENG